MTDYAYRLLNVFTLDGNRLSGNSLCVFAGCMKRYPRHARRS